MSLRSCYRCGGSVRHLERTADRTPNDHHNNVYYCPTCDVELVAG